MHFEILVEGQTELTALSILMKNIVGKYDQPHTWKIHKHQGIGKIPIDPTIRPNRCDRTLLHNLPSKLRAYGEEDRDDLFVIVLVDLDEREDCIGFKSEISDLLDYCDNRPNCLFRIAIEELEAWYLGDQVAIKNAYPNANQEIMSEYMQESQCGTWEKLADSIHPGGLSALRTMGKRSVRILEQKVVWAKKITPFMDVDSNRSKSFQVFRDGIRTLAGI
ncbi:MAG: DUF4276 family protein [Candidatus Electryoneaceae bacterium]|nr:DUF4276 family protein [Candidatus Electryoneaceae bacterium]